MALTVSGTATFNGNVDLGSDSNDTISMTGKVDTNIIPSTGFKDLGDTNTYWDNGYIFNGKFNNISISGTNAKLDMNNKPIEECGDIDFDGTEHIKRSGVDFIEFQQTMNIGFDKLASLSEEERWKRRKPLFEKNPQKLLRTPEVF